MRLLIVGDIVKLKIACLGNEEGSEGVVIENYTIGDKSGAQIIFENGEYDGFSLDDQEKFLERIGHSKEFSEYRFTNVWKLSDDFANGRFDEIFE